MHLMRAAIGMVFLGSCFGAFADARASAFCEARFEQGSARFRDAFEVPSGGSFARGFRTPSDVEAFRISIRTQPGELFYEGRTWSNWVVRNIRVRGEKLSKFIVTHTRPDAETESAGVACEKPSWQLPEVAFSCVVVRVDGSSDGPVVVRPGETSRPLRMRGFGADQGTMTCGMTADILSCDLRSYDLATDATTYMNSFEVNAGISEVRLITDSFGGTHTVTCTQKVGEVMR